MNARPEVLEAARQWVVKAEEDLTNAEHTLTLREECPFATVCFHAQQIAEKYLKAVLTIRSVPFPKTHDLTELLMMVPPGVALELAGPEVGRLNVYAIAARYPGDPDPFDRTEAEAALALAKRVREAARTWLPREALAR